MKTQVLVILGTVLTAGMLGCAHSTMRGTVAMKASDNEAHVYLGKDEVKPGDQVTLFKNECRRAPLARQGLGEDPLCEKVVLGAGTVARTLNEHYSVVHVNPGVPFEEGTIVEKTN